MYFDLIVIFNKRWLQFKDITLKDIFNYFAVSHREFTVTNAVQVEKKIICYVRENVKEG